MYGSETLLNDVQNFYRLHSSDCQFPVEVYIINRPKVISYGF